jgi:hypothetical protein
MGRVISAPAESKARSSDKADVVTWRLSMSPSTESNINELARTLGVSPDDAIGLGLAFLEVAARAKKEGKSIAIVDDQGNIDTKITGF